MKFFKILIIFLILTSCSVDKNTGIWNYKNKNSYTKENVVDVVLDHNFKFNEYILKIKKYSISSDYPDISK